MPIDFTNGGDTGYDLDSSIEPVSDGEEVKASITNRPTQNLRRRTEVLRKDADTKEAIINSDRGLTCYLTGGSVIFDGAYDNSGSPPSAGTAGSGQLRLDTASQKLVIRPMNAPAQTTFASYTASATSPTREIVFTSKKYAYEGGNNIQIEVVDTGRTTGANATVTTGGGQIIFADEDGTSFLPQLITVDIINGTATVSDIKTAIDGDPTASQLVSVTVNSGGTSAAFTIPKTNLSGGVDAELHEITKETLDAFWAAHNDTTNDVLLQVGDTLGIYFANEIQRRKSIVEKGNTQVPQSQLFNARFTPEKTLYAIPVATCVSTTEAYLFGGGGRLYQLKPAIPSDGISLRGELASISPPGASLIGYDDVQGYFNPSVSTVQDALTDIWDTLTTNGTSPSTSGASRVAIYDGAGKFTGTNVEDALSEVATEADLASNATGDGASMIGIEDSANRFTGTTVEAALAETALEAHEELIRSQALYSGILYDSGTSNADINPDMIANTITIGSFKAVIDGKIVVFPGQTLTSADFSTNARKYTLVYVDSTGTLNIIEAASQLTRATLPSSDPGGLPICIVNHDFSGSGLITVTDCRRFLQLGSPANELFISPVSPTTTTRTQGNISQFETFISAYYWEKAQYRSSNSDRVRYKYTISGDVTLQVLYNNGSGTGLYITDNVLETINLEGAELIGYGDGYQDSLAGIRRSTLKFNNSQSGALIQNPSNVENIALVRNTDVAVSQTILDDPTRVKNVYLEFSNVTSTTTGHYGINESINGAVLSDVYIKGPSLNYGISIGANNVTLDNVYVESVNTTDGIGINITSGSKLYVNATVGSSYRPYFVSASVIDSLIDVTVGGRVVEGLVSTNAWPNRHIVGKIYAQGGYLHQLGSWTKTLTGSLIDSSGELYPGNTSYTTVMVPKEGSIVHIVIYLPALGAETATIKVTKNGSVVYTSSALSSSTVVSFDPLSAPSFVAQDTIGVTFSTSAGASGDAVVTIYAEV